MTLEFNPTSLGTSGRIFIFMIIKAGLKKMDGANVIPFILNDRSTILPSGGNYPHVTHLNDTISQASVGKQQHAGVPAFLISRRE